MQQSDCQQLESLSYSMVDLLSTVTPVNLIFHRHIKHLISQFGSANPKTTKDPIVLILMSEEQISSKLECARLSNQIILLSN